MAVKGRGGPQEELRGFCSSCGREAGGFFRPQLWQCPKCRLVLCHGCAAGKKVGLVFKKPVCPVCLLEMAEGGFSLRSGR